MSWNNAGPATELAPGQSVAWSYSWPNGQDMGLELAGPNFIIGFTGPESLATLVASDQGKALQGINVVGGIGASVTYVVTITNVSSTEFGWHNLQGGTVS
jgi:hypothetical protein